MAYKIHNPYKDCHILDLNMLGIQPKLKIRLHEVFLLFTPLVITGAFIAVSMMPEMGFLAQCQNIPGGDICHISVK